MHVIEGAIGGYAKIVGQKKGYDLDGVVKNDPKRDIVLLAVSNVNARSLKLGDLSNNAHGTTGFEGWLMRYHGQPIRRPQSPTYYPSRDFINWHVKEVFRGPSRYTARL